MFPDREAPARPALRIARWSLHPYRLQYTRPVRWSDIVEDAATFVLLRLESEDGAVGVGEITVKPTWNGATLRSLSVALEEVVMPRLLGADASDPVALRRSLDPIYENQATKALVDNACWDLAAAARGEALWKTWGGQASVNLSWAVTRQAPKFMAEEAEAMVARYGFRHLKVKGGQGFDTDVEGMRAIRTAVGDGVTLYVDANSAYTREQAPDWVRLMADEGAVVVEDPSILWPDDQFSALQSASSVPVLVDFNCPTPRETALFIERGARAVSLKPGRVGLSDTLEMARQSAAAGCRNVVGLFCESLLGTYSAMQLAATLPPSALASEVTWHLQMRSQIVSTPAAIERGLIRLPDSPSLAALVDWDAVRRHAA